MGRSPRQQLITWGAAVAIIGGAAALVSATYRGEQEVRQMSRAEVGHHQDRDVDRAHADLPKRYVTRKELNAQLHTIDTRLLLIDQQQKQILKRLPIRPRRNRRNR